MLKRVEKRIRKKEKEAELGLDGDMKEMLGMNDTDSDESSASSDSEDSAGEEERGPPAPEDEDVSDAEEDVDEDVEEEEDGEESEEDEDEEDEGPSMNVSEALRDPLYLISTEPEVKGCILCPGKLLKNTTMIEVHLQSGAHTRHFAHLRESAMVVDADTDVRDLVRAQLVKKAEGQGLPSKGKLSKRAQKKKAKLAAIKVKREKQKIMKAKYRAKKDAKLQSAAAAHGASNTSDAEGDSPAKPPPAKKRKVQQKQSAASNSDTDDDVVKLSKNSQPTSKPNAKALTKSLTKAKPPPTQPTKNTLSSVKAKKRRHSGQV